jgi:hypothetical protein
MKKLYIPVPQLSRRRILQSFGTSLLLPSALAQANTSQERKFLFVHCQGGWDQCYFSAPLHGNSNIDMEEDSTEAIIQGIHFVDSAIKENMHSFFEQFGDRSALINGIESRSVAHDVCLRLINTGTSLASTDDWSSVLAGNAQNDPIMPLVAISGPLYTFKHTESVVRIGSNGQLAALLNGNSLEELNISYSPNRSELEDNFLQNIIDKRIEEKNDQRGKSLELLLQCKTAEERMRRLQDLEGQLDLTGGNTLRDRLDLAVDVLERGLTRCVTLGYEGWQGLSWDTHAAGFLQSFHLNELFGELQRTMEKLQQTSSPQGVRLLDEVTVVVVSEMGRFPQYNNRNGKEHWTYTSALLMGSGIRGGQTIGHFDSNCFGQPVDLESGEVNSTNGTNLLPGNLGATLLTLGDVDPQKYTAALPIQAIIS